MSGEDDRRMTVGSGRKFAVAYFHFLLNNALRKDANGHA
jgi:hypothetical protein